MMKPIPPEIVNPILEIVSYGLTFLLGVVTKWLQGKRKQFKNIKNEEANDSDGFYR